MMVYSRTKVLARRREVTSLLVRGVSPGEIAEMLKIPRQTIYNDVRVIRSGKNDALFAYTRNEIIAQLYLNAQERMRFLWRVVEEADKYYAKVQALRELRFNDERIFDRLSDPKHNPELEYTEAQVKEYIEGYDGLRERVEQAEERRMGMEDTIRKWLEKGQVERAINYLSPRQEPPSDKSESA
jgi:predicted DNA-binding protein YlxM (UPF0122 family)